MDRRALLIAAILLAGTAGAAADTADPVQVTVRVEGATGLVWHGTVELAGTYTIVADNSGRTWELPAHTPLGALHAASEAGGFAITVTDAWASSDFTVTSVAGQAGAGIWWWDYRVDLVATYYGNQNQWLEHGPGLNDGDEVLWYLETTDSRPLRLAAHATPAHGDAADPPADGAVALHVQWPLVDPQHRPGTPWPTQVWIPAHGARVHGDIAVDAPAGLGVAVVERGTYTVRAVVEPSTFPAHAVPSAPTEVVVE